MVRYAQLVMGSAGTGKSTYCATMQEHATACRRTVRVVNLDPAAESFRYAVDFDVRALISVDDVMEQMGLGPNGGLLYAMEYLVDNMEWLEEQLDCYAEDDYVIFDAPGQIELYTHVPVFKRVAECLRDKGFNVCVVYCVDATFVTDASKFIAGNLVALSAMVQLELPHINVLTKCDLAENKDDLERFLTPSGDDLAADLTAGTAPRFRRLNQALCRLLDDYDMVSFLPLDITDEDSVANVMQQVDNAIQFGEDAEPKEVEGGDGEGWDGGGGGGGGGDDE
jgi:GTPase SAR1 family protein